MKRFYLLALLSLFQMGGVICAQPTVTNSDATSISTEKYYYLYNNGRGGYINISYKFTTGERSDVLLSNSITAGNWVKYIVRFEADGDNYRVKLFDDSYLTTAGSGANVQASNDVANAISVSATYDATNKWALKNLTNNLYFNGNAATFAYWGTTQDTGNGKYYIREVGITAEEFAAAKAEATPQNYFSTSYEDVKWFNMTIRNYSNFVAYSETEPYNCRLAATLEDRANPAYQWALIGNATDGVQMVNKATGAGYTLTNVNGNAVLREGNQTWLIDENSDGFVLHIDGTNDYINDVGGSFKFWADAAARTDAGSTMHFMPAPANPLVDVTFNVFYNDVKVAEAVSKLESNVAIQIPDELQRDYVTLTYDNTIIASAELVVPVTATWNGPFTLYESDEDVTWQNLAVRSNYYVTSGNKDGDNALKPINANALGLVEDAYQWAFVGDPYHIQLFNKAEDNNFGYSEAAKVNQGIPGFQADASYWTIKASTNNDVPANSFVLFVPGTNLQINQYGGPTGSLKFYDNGTTGDVGSAFTIFDVPTNFAEYVVAEIAPYFEAAEYFVLNDAAKTTVGYNESYKTDCPYENYKSMREALPTVLANANSYVYPGTGYYRVESKFKPGFWLQWEEPANYANNNSGVKFVEKGNTSASSVVYFEKEEGSVNKYAIKIQGKYLGAPDMTGESTNTWSGRTSTQNDDPHYYTFEVKTPGQVTFRGATEGEQNDYSYAQLSDGQNNCFVTWAYEAKSEMSIVPVADIDITLNAGGDSYTYATLYVPFGVTLPDGVDAYVVSSTEDDSHATTENIGKNIPAATPVILRGTAASVTATINDAATADVSSNILLGTYLPRTLGEDDVVLGKSDETGIGFYKSSATLGANKAYLDLSGSPVKGFVLDFDDDATGIEKTLSDSPLKSENIYNLAGQRILKMQKGLYIVNGKKVLVK